MQDKMIRYRFNVPNDDQIVIAWLKKQYDRHMSIRELIKKYVKEHGCNDVFASSFQVKGNLVENNVKVLEKSVIPKTQNVQPRSLNKQTTTMMDMKNLLDN